MLASQNIKLMLLDLNIIAIIANTKQKLASVGIFNKKLVLAYLTNRLCWHIKLIDSVGLSNK